MNNKRKQVWMVLGLWSIVLVIFLSLYIVGSGPNEWGTNSNIRFMTVIVFGVGYLAFSIIQLRGRKFKKDEREYLIELKSIKATMTSILMYVYFFGIVIYAFYENSVLMPASWMWFLAYTTVFLSYIINSGFYLWYEKRID